MEEQKQGMSSTAKFFIGCGVVGLIVLVGGGYWLYKTIKDALVTDPVEVRQIANETLYGAELGDEFVPHMAFKAMGVVSVNLSYEGGHQVVILSLPGGAQADGVDADPFGESDVPGTKVGEESFAVPGSGDVTFEKVSFADEGHKMMRLQGMLPKRGESRISILYVGPEDGFSSAGLERLLDAIPAPK